MTSPACQLSCQLDITVNQPADLVFSVAVASAFSPLEESLTMTVDGAPIEFYEVPAAAQVRLHRAKAVPRGNLLVEYSARVARPGDPMYHGEAEEILYLRPSRYCDSDRLAQVAFTHFKDFRGVELVAAIREWVHTSITYTPGSSRVVDGALDTYLSRRGVCRDMAHLVITFCRAMNVPARLVSVYAPGLQPPDFHAVAEVWVDGAWHVIDPTGLAPRQSMVRIATGRDASDTAFLTVVDGRMILDRMGVQATIEGQLPIDDGLAPVQLL